MKRLILCVLLTAGCSSDSDPSAPGNTTRPQTPDVAVSPNQTTEGRATSETNNQISSTPPAAPAATQNASNGPNGSNGPDTSPDTEHAGDDAADPLTRLFAAFVENPDRESYLAVRGQLVQSPAYRPYSDEMDNANQLLEEGRFPEAVLTLRAAMPNLLLSPSAHQMLAYSYAKMEDEEAAAAETKAAMACLRGIQSTGDGTEQQPWLVVRTSDEYDVMATLQKRMQQQSLVNDNDLHLDRVECTDGSTLWFDVTDAFRQLGASFR